MCVLHCVAPPLSVPQNFIRTATGYSRIPTERSSEQSTQTAAYPWVFGGPNIPAGRRARESADCSRRRRRFGVFEIIKLR
jgi:hypothetical protein